MPLKLEEIGEKKKKEILSIFQPASCDVLTVNPTNNSRIVRYVINMFRIENDTSIRPRKINRTPWNETDHNSKLTQSHSVFRITETNRQVEIPISLPLEHLSGQKQKRKNFYESLEQYFNNSTLHGLRYVGDTSISVGERLFWFCSFLTAVAFAAFFITSIYSKYDLNPVIISLNPTPTPLSSLPFPAITICNMNQAKKSEAEHILHSGTDVEKLLLDDYCNSNITNLNASVVSDDATKWDNVQKFMIRVNPSCQEMLKVCMWKQQDVECDYIFNSALTDEGLCCTFNALPRPFIFRNPREMGDLNLTFPPKVDDWNPEKGYSANASIDALPWRAPGAGTHLGLTVVIDAAIKSYYCSSTSSIGFKILLHNPIETPKMADYAFLVAPGLETRIAIIPKISDASSSIRNIHISKRMCFFSNERHLLFYRTYTERNCKLECQANYTLEQCGCVPFYLPKNKQKKICSKKQEVCSNSAKEELEGPDQENNVMNCECLPGCFELGFESIASYGKLSNVFKTKEYIIKNETLSYFIENMAVLHFYFLSTQFTRNTKSELYGFSEFLSNTGGLLGLFLGFSFLSAVEIAYYLSLKLLCKLIRKRSNTRHRTKEKINNSALVYPFAK